jgi:hypothetical protein
MPKSAFEPCIPTRGTTVPDRPEWIHEIKHDGYRLIIQRDGKRVRLFTRNGHDWSGRFPMITEAALRNRPSLRLALTGLRGRSRCTLPENLSLRIGRDQMGDGGAMAFNR